MTIIFLCVWSCVVISSWMILAKYHWTRPPLGLLIGFLVMGIAVTLPAFLCNQFLSRETELWVFSNDRLTSFFGFFIGAGLSEEFWKMGGGCVFLAWCYLFNRNFKHRSCDCLLCFVVLGVSFGAVENLVAYSYLDSHILISRGLVAIPLHAVMGMIHGSAVDMSITRSRLWPLIVGYLVTVLLHTMNDTMTMFIPVELMPFPLTIFTTTLIIGGIYYWLRLPEVMSLTGDKAPDNDR